MQDISKWKVDRIQILTVEELMKGKQPQLPGAVQNETFKSAHKNEKKNVSRGLFD